MAKQLQSIHDVSVSLNDIYYSIFLSFLIISQYISVINIVSLFISFFLSFFFFYKKRYDYLAALLFVYSFYSTGLNLYSFKIIYAIILFFIIIKVGTHCNYSVIRCFFISHSFMLYFSFLLFYSLIRSSTDFNITLFQSDLIILIGVVLSSIIFENISKNDFFKMSLIVVFASQISLFTFIHTNVVSNLGTDFLNRIIYPVTGGEVSLILIIPVIYYLINKKGSIIFRLLISFFIISNILTSQNIGSIQLIFMFIALVLSIRDKLFARLNIKVFVFVILGVICIFFLSKELFEDKINLDDSPIMYKVENVTKMIGNLDDIYMIPLSPRVRVIEFLNLINTDSLTLFFGRGLAGTFSDNKYMFEPDSTIELSNDDFSEKERLSRVFGTAHNTNYPLLKYGLLYFIFIFYISAHCLKMENIDKSQKVVIWSFFLASTCTLGWTFQTSLVIGLLSRLVNKNCYYKNELEVF